MDNKTRETLGKKIFNAIKKEITDIKSGTKKTPMATLPVCKWLTSKSV